MKSTRSTTSATRSARLHRMHDVGRSFTYTVFCAVAMSLVACRAKTPYVEAADFRMSAPTSPSESIRCSAEGLPSTLSKDGPAHRMLDEMLRKCIANKNGKEIIEPSWGFTQWYGKVDLYPSTSNRASSGKKGLIHSTSFLAEPLVQSRLAHGDVLARAIGSKGVNPVSMVFFNKAAKQGIDSLMSLPQALTPEAAIKWSEMKVDPGATIAKLSFTEACPVRIGPIAKDSCDIDVFEDSALPWVSKIERRTYSLSLNPSGPCKIDRANRLVTLNCFYYIFESDRHLNYDPYDLAGGPPIQLITGSRLYLLTGLHLMKADVPNWTWATYWWTADAPDKRVCPEKEVSAYCNSPWPNYNMNDLRYTKLDASEPGIRFNPYIEAPADRSSNCIYCHARAMYRPGRKGYFDTDTGSGRRHDDPIVVPCRPGSPVRSAPNPFDCKDALPAHFLWSLSENLPNRAAAATTGPK